MTGSLMAPDELRLTIASLPDLRTFAFNRLSDKLSLVPLNNSFASFPVTVTVAENGSPKPEFTLNPPKAATEPVEANSDTDNAISLILLSTFKIYPLIIRRHDFNAHNFNFLSYLLFTFLAKFNHKKISITHTSCRYLAITLVYIAYAFPTSTTSISALPHSGNHEKDAKISSYLYDGGFHLNHSYIFIYMKAASDFIAVILFFLTYILTKNIIWATSVAVVAGIAQAAFLWWKFRKLETMQWVSLLLIVVFGGATILTGNRTFIMWKPTLLFWIGAIAILISNIIKKNGLQALLGKEISLPDAVWKKLAISWMLFLIIMGFVNLAVAYPFSAEREAVWNNYKFFGAIPLTFLFSLAQVIYLNRYLPKENKND